MCLPILHLPLEPKTIRGPVSGAAGHRHRVNQAGLATSVAPKRTRRPATALRPGNLLGPPASTNGSSYRQPRRPPALTGIRVRVPVRDLLREAPHELINFGEPNHRRRRNLDRVPIHSLFDKGPHVEQTHPVVAVLGVVTPALPRFVNLRVKSNETVSPSSEPDREALVVICADGSKPIAIRGLMRVIE
jgi:hypothetical protein